MKRSELIESKEYWIADIQLNLVENIRKYMEENNLTQKEFASKIGCSQSYVSQLYSGDYDHKISKLVELSLAIGKAPVIKFESIDKYIENDKPREI